MRGWSLLALRVTLGWLMVVWGVDKVVNVSHGMTVSRGFYHDLFSNPLLLQGFGAVQMALGMAVVLGLGRRAAYPALMLVTGATLLGVWRSVVDPWGWVLAGTTVLFYPSVIIFAAALVVRAFAADDTLTLDAVLAARPRAADGGRPALS